MIYKVVKGEEKNEFIINSMVKVRVSADENQKTKIHMQYDDKLLTAKEAKRLTNEFRSYLNRL